MGPGRETDVASTLGGDQAPVPGVVLVASGPEPRRHVLAQGAASLTLGRSIATPGGRIALDDGRMSREHATVERVGAEWIIRDLASRNGTFVDGERVSDQVQVRGDAVVRCGHSVFLLLADARDQDRDHDVGDWIVGPELARIFADVGRHATAPTLLVHGEAGAGKELVARHYHRQGSRADGPFVAVDCARIPDGVAERLLFGGGSRGGDGAIESAIGALRNADGGTLFLDEIAELDLPVQARLLRAIDTGEVGAAAGLRVDVGVVAASHRDLRGAVAARRFRGDLYGRLAHAVVVVPPLRHRRGDIPRLVVREVAQVDRGLAIHPRLIELCCVRPWPGNVRALQRAIRGAATIAVAAGRDLVRPEDLLPIAGLPGSDEPSSVSGTGPRPKVSPAEVDRHAIEAALEASAGNVSAAARALGLHRTQLYRLLQRHGLARTTDDTTE